MGRRESAAGKANSVFHFATCRIAAFLVLSVPGACRRRVWPIVMTTVAMGAGMMPIALGLGSDPNFRAPLVIVVIGGLTSSTFLSLLVIPVAFPCGDDLIDKMCRLLGRKPR